ncbi:MAG TPA: hypothetical protein VMZ53_03485 [Kofleriaceae bacterium]|nr:hypothetical protein [Kofleriaceae bacterium]
MHLRVVIACVAFTGACKGHDKDKAPPAASNGSAETAKPAEPSVPTLATVAELGGNVKVKRKGATEWTPAEKDEALHAGDAVRTADESFVRLKLAGRGTLEISEPTTVIIDDALSLQDGTVMAVVDPGATLVVKAADGSEAHIAAPSGASQPSTFRISPAADNSLDIAAIQGDVAVKTQAGEQAVTAGKVTRVVKQSASEPVSLIAFPKSVAPGIDARFHFVADKPIDLQWATVKEASGYRVQISKDTEFRQLVLNEDATSTAVQFAPKAPGVYAWRVAARDKSDHLGEYGFGRRIYFEQEPPKDLLLTPPDGAKVGFSDSYPKIEFSWQSLGDASEYKLVVGRGAVPSVDPIVTIPSSGQKVEVGSLREGVYHWGVYAVVDGHDEPIFMTAREITIRKQRVKAHTENLWNEKR